jgi:hypothetical protein
LNKKNKMNKKNHTIKVSDSFAKTDENHSYETAFRRWLVREIKEQRITIKDAIQQFNFNPKSGRLIIYTMATFVIKGQP